MVILTGLSYIFIGLVGLYQIWQTFVGVSIGMEVFHLKRTWSVLVVDLIIALLGVLLFVISVFSILTGIVTLIGGTL